jgi:hypothetical protein
MGELQHLSELTIAMCNNLRSLPPSILDLTELQSLELGNLPEEQICDFFVPGCNNLHKSLESVVMHSCNLREGDGLSKVWNFLLRCPKLESIDLRQNHIASLKAFLLTSPSGTDENKYSGKPSRLRSLHLRPIVGDPEDLKALLNNHLQLEYIDIIPEHSSHSSFTPEVQYLLDINKCGRVLLEGGVRPIPLSVWSKVLERTSSVLDGDLEHTAAVFFYFLRNGPVFANRNEPWK